MIHIIISGFTLIALFILFVVLSKTLNNIISQLNKLEYMLQKEYDFKLEEKEVHRLFEEKNQDTDA